MSLFSTGCMVPDSLPKVIPVSVVRRMVRAGRDAGRELVQVTYFDGHSHKQGFVADFSADFVSVVYSHKEAAHYDIVELGALASTLLERGDRIDWPRKAAQ